MTHQHLSDEILAERAGGHEPENEPEKSRVNSGASLGVEQDLEFILDKTKDLWEELRGQSIFLTGGTGFIGRWFLESFSKINRDLKLNASLDVLSRDPQKFLKTVPHLAADSAIRFVTGDVCDFLFPAKTYYCIIHAATPASLPWEQQDVVLLKKIIEQGTERVLEFAALTQVKKFLLVSSGAADMDQQTAHKLDDPKTVYGMSKRKAEALCESASKQCNFDLKIARCFTFVGPFLLLDSYFVVGNFMSNFLKGEPIRIRGDANARRSFMYTADLMVWLWTILLKGTPGQRYDVGSDRDVSIFDLAKLIASMRQPSVEIQLPSQRVGNMGANNQYLPNLDAAKIELGLKVWTDLENSIKKTLEYLSR